MKEQFKRRAGEKMVRGKLYSFPGPLWEAEN